MQLLDLPIKGGDGLKTPVKKSSVVHFFPEPTPSEPRQCSSSPVQKSPPPSPKRQHSESEAESLPEDASVAQPEQSGETLGRLDSSVKLYVHSEFKVFYCMFNKFLLSMFDLLFQICLCLRCLYLKMYYKRVNLKIQDLPLLCLLQRSLFQLRHITIVSL